MAQPQFEKLDNIVRGNTLYAVDFEITDEIDDAIDLSDTNIRCQFRKDNVTGERVVDLSLGNGLTIKGAGSNIIQIDEMIIDWDAGNYFYDVVITFIATGNIDTAVNGTMEVLQDTTNDDY